MFLTVGGVAVGVTSSIVFPYKRDHTIDDSATVKNGEAVFTHSSSRSSAPGTDRGTPAAIGLAGHGALDRVAGAHRSRDSSGDRVRGSMAGH